MCIRDRASPSSSLSRARSKASNLYSFKGRDLVDSAAEDESLVGDLAEEQLPENMKSMSVEERKAFVQEQANARKEIQAKIKEATSERDKFIASKRKEMATPGGEATLGDAMSAAVGRQLKAAGFEMNDQ